MHDLLTTLRKGADDPVGSFPNLRWLFEAVGKHPLQLYFARVSLTDERG
jgi:hypothetical protein